MTKFIIYTYQFSPLLTIFDTVEESTAAMQRKNEIFEELFTDFKSLRITQGEGAAKRVYPLEGVNNKQFILFHIGDPKKVPLHKIVDGKFVDTSDTTSPHCMVLIDNRKDVQRIYIEKKMSAFRGKTDRVAKILQENFNILLTEKHLRMDIGNEYREQVFWSFISLHEKDIRSIEFFLPYPNLPRVSDNVAEVLKEMQVDYNCSMNVRMNAPENGRMSLPNQSDKRMRYFVTADAIGGVPIKVKLDGQRGFSECGKHVYKSVDLPDNVSQLKEEDFNSSQREATIAYLINLLKGDVRPVAQ